MNNVFVIDTVAFINYHNVFFSEKDRLNPKTRAVITKCLDYSDNEYKLIIPSVVFLEIFKKFLVTEEKSRQFYYEIFIRVKECVDVEIKPIEKEVVQLLLEIDLERTLELHDKIIYASAAQLNCSLITMDPKIIKANKKDRLIPDIIF